MLKINRRTDYAVRVGVALAKRPQGTRLPTQVVQAEMQIPRPFLLRIISELSRASLIQTFTGPTGGIQLARPAKEITLLDIHQAMEEPLCLSDCLVAPGDCQLSSNCPVRLRWGRLQGVIRRELRRTTLWQLAREALALEALDMQAQIPGLAGQDVVPEIEHRRF
jgi:Rrf2 family protein